MNQLSSHISEQSIQNHNNNNADDQILSIGSVTTLERAMKVNKLSEILDCIKDMKFYAKTVEQDLPDYLAKMSMNRKDEIDTYDFQIDNFIVLAKQRLNNNHFILLHDFIEQKKVIIYI